ncbi:MAG TPA: cytochrome c biogenesis heme-transporting ATPase CcmA [Pelomicrobium sp.]|nr:cytochrome c biogenesis heme-transporting ATPase CcmA [Pelomicrobium sp.]
MLAASALTCIRGERRIFASLGFTLAAGELLHVLGPNGSGKTSLLRMLCGLLQPAEGEITWSGEAMRRLGDEYLAQIAYVGHLNGLKDDLTALENLAVYVGIEGAADGHDSRDSLARMGLGDCTDFPARWLSQGQRRRLALSRLLAVPRKLWILDEPFTGLDKASVTMLQDLLEQHLETGGLVVLTSHQDMRLARNTVRELHLGPSRREA